MEIKHLHSFRAAAEALSFINAARKLHISQPALSAQIQALDAELGVQLLERTRRSVHLTKPGEAFLQNTYTILRMTDEATINQSAIDQIPKRKNEVIAK
jgi:DNA-binding transcriptional LysR family regulator